MRHFIVLAVAVMLMSCGTEDLSSPPKPNSAPPFVEDLSCYPLDTELNYQVIYYRISGDCDLNTPDSHLMLLGEYPNTSFCSNNYRAESKDSCIIAWERNCVSENFYFNYEEFIGFSNINGVTVPLLGRLVVNVTSRMSSWECRDTFGMNFVEL